MQRKSDLPDTTEISTVIDHQWSVRRHPRIIRLPFRPSLRNHLSRAFLCCCCCLQFLLWSRLGSGRRHHHCDVNLSLSRCSLLHHPYSAIAKPNPSSLHFFGCLRARCCCSLWCFSAPSLLRLFGRCLRSPGCHASGWEFKSRYVHTLHYQCCPVLGFERNHFFIFFIFIFFNFIEPLVRVWKQFSRFIKSWVPQTSQEFGAQFG